MQGRGSVPQARGTGGAAASDGADPVQRIGERFAQLYYGLLAVRPSALRRFYTEDSQMSRSWCTFGSQVPKSGHVHRGPREIMDAIMSSVGGQDPAMGSMSPVVVTNVETVQVMMLPDNSGIMLQFTGCITYLIENQMMRFSQSVMLERSPTDKGALYIRNDITHYLDAMGQMAQMARTPMMGQMAGQMAPVMAQQQPPTMAPQGPPAQPQQAAGNGQQGTSMQAASASVAASAAAAASGAPPSAPAAIAGKASAPSAERAGPSVLPPAPATAPVADAAPSTPPVAEPRAAGEATELTKTPSGASAGKSWASIAAASSAKAGALGGGAAPPSSPSQEAPAQASPGSGSTAPAPATVPQMPASGHSAGSASPSNGERGPTVKIWVSNIPVEDSSGGGQMRGGPIKGHQVREVLLECLRQHAPSLSGESIEVDRKDERKPFAFAVCSERTARELVSLSKQRKVALRDKHLILEVSVYNNSSAESYHGSSSGGRGQWHEDRGERPGRGKGGSGWQPRESRGGRGGWKGSR